MIVKKGSREMLVESLKELLENQPFEKISVQDIVDNCQLTRTTFYRYFKDKYDLMNWFYYQKMQKFVDEMEEASIDSWTEMSRTTLHVFKENAAFFSAVFEFRGQNSFEEFWFNYCCDYCYELIRKSSGNPLISVQDRLAVKIHIGGNMCVLFDWVRNGCIESEDIIIELMYECMPTSLKKYFK